MATIDARRFRQELRRLLTSAIKFTPAGGHNNPPLADAAAKREGERN